MAHFLIITGMALFTGSYLARTLVRAHRLRTTKSTEELIEMYKHAFEDPMTRKEAALILGVNRSADESEIMKSYKTLIALNHPDRGGTDYMAMKINQAKDILLRKE